ncbi:hypothetical protein B0T16DRAFT_394114 [Cercophora newfieldiana]|uniref:Uncharacterized protein n=1 Tax=Cercophora newfieldiana TaxID=92897 RepID=A0AA39XZL5_9PEZI|nr:hypothetical protein B0T16DRAFT_394114 [Cercophora newfieldiana]
MVAEETQPTKRANPGQISEPPHRSFQPSAFPPAPPAHFFSPTLSQLFPPTPAAFSQPPSVPQFALSKPPQNRLAQPALQIAPLARPSIEEVMKTNTNGYTGIIRTKEDFERYQQALDEFHDVEAPDSMEDDDTLPRTFEAKLALVKPLVEAMKDETELVDVADSHQVKHVRTIPNVCLEVKAPELINDLIEVHQGNLGFRKWALTEKKDWTFESYETFGARFAEVVTLLKASSQRTNFHHPQPQRRPAYITNIAKPVTATLTILEPASSLRDCRHKAFVTTTITATTRVQIVTMETDFVNYKSEWSGYSGSDGDEPGSHDADQSLNAGQYAFLDGLSDGYGTGWYHEESRQSQENTLRASGSIERMVENHRGLGLCVVKRLAYSRLGPTCGRLPRGGAEGNEALDEPPAVFFLDR